MQRKSEARLAFVALLAGATGIGFAPIFVRLSETGPSATAFYRILIALPVLWFVSTFEAPDRAPAPEIPLTRYSAYGWCAVAGAFFAGDLAFWHWSIKLTSVANSTLLTNFAPLFVTIGARFLFAERITWTLVFGMAVALVGSAFLVGENLHLHTDHLKGDLLAAITALFYAAYLLAIKRLRAFMPPARILTRSGLVSCGLLLVVAIVSRDSLRIRSFHGWVDLLALGLISHLGGQGLITYALAHLPAGFASVSLLVQPIVAAFTAWLVLSESLTPSQMLGGTVILAGIAFASRNRGAK